MIKTRDDIDGLRALAIGPVVLYHCGFKDHIPGGFIGVDIFFVISGFLITGLVTADIEKGRFSLVDFYNRRVRRIFPALFTVYAFIFLAALALLLPSEVANVGKGVLSSLAFVSNVYFYSLSGYFDAESALNPLLHTWSLSVEEQFYVVLPVSLYAMRSLSRAKVTGIVLAVTLASFAASIWSVATNPTAAFYFVQYRAWELGLGSLLALGFAPQTLTPRAANISAAAGLAMIVGSVFLIDARTPFPGLAALPACLGTAMIIHAGAHSQTLVARLLSLTPMRFVGLVSYSFYLWHWPVWVYTRINHRPDALIERLAIVLASFLLAVLSWHFIERPFRTRPYRTTPIRTLANAAIGMAVVMLIAFGIGPAAAVLRPTSQRAEQVLAFASYQANPTYRTGKCFLTSAYNNFAYFAQPDCLALSADKPNYVLIGDSHAAHFYAGLSAAPNDVNVMQATASGCKPIDGTHGDRWCTDLINFMFNDFLPKHHVDAVILSAAWEDADLPGLLRAIGKLKPYAGRVLVFGPTVEYDFALPRILARAVASGDESGVAGRRVGNQRRTDRLFSAALAGSAAQYLDVYDVICPADKCMLFTNDGNPIMFDNQHFAVAGSLLVVTKLAPLIFGSVTAPALASEREIVVHAPDAAVRAVDPGGGLGH
jgi:peptidoglycan/LPS O-acetylase OafA/YrhL